MNEQIRAHIDELFREAPNSRWTLEVKEEMGANLEDKFQDMLARGLDEQDALKQTLEGIGSVDELISDLRSYPEVSPATPEQTRQWQQESRRNDRTASSQDTANGEPTGHTNGTGTPPPPPAGDWQDTASRWARTASDFFNGHGRKAPPRDARAYQAISAVFWPLLVFAYLLCSFVTMRWDVTWILFLIGAFVQNFIGFVTGVQPRRGAMMGMLWTGIVACYFIISFFFHAWSWSWMLFVAGGLLSAMVNGLWHAFGSTSGTGSYQTHEARYALTGMKMLKFQYQHQEVTIRVHDSNELIVRHESALNRPFEVQQDGRSLSLTANTAFGFGGHEMVELLIPRQYLFRFELTTSSGSINLRDSVGWQACRLHSFSGGIRVDGEIISADSISLGTTSGGISVHGNLSADSLQVRTVSGHIQLRDGNTRLYDLASTSGSLMTGAMSGQGEVKNVSGHIRVGLSAQARDTRVGTVSGSVRVALAPELRFQMEVSTLSGNLTSNLGAEARLAYGHRKTSVVVGEPPYVRFDVKTTSGSVTLERLAS